MNDLKELRDNAIVSATYDTILQIGLRIVSFILNAFIVRHTSPAVFAVMTVRLHLLYSTGLLLSREAFRRAALSSNSHVSIRKLVNLVWLGSIFSIPLSILGFLVWSYVMERPPTSVTSDYVFGVSALSFSIIIELLAEVPYILTELHLWAKTKVLIEGLMQLSRCILLALGIFLWPEKAIMVYGISHIVGSLLYLILFYSVYFVVLKNKEESTKLLIGNFRSLFPSFKAFNFKEEIDQDLWSVSWSFFKQGWLKEALTEGEFYMMNLFPLISLSQQGVYQVVNNLGSLAARLVFRSVEAASYKFFAQMLTRGVSIKDQIIHQQAKMEEVSRMLKDLLRNLILVSLVIVVFGWSYSRTLLRFYGGAELSDLGTNLLRAQSIYVVFLALNGVTEAYTFAAMSDKELESYNRSLVSFSAIYVVLCLVSTQLFGALGFIIANCVNMLLRIIHSLFYINDHFQGTSFDPLKCLQLSNKIVTSFCVIWATTAISEVFIYPVHVMFHVILGGIALVSLVYVLRWDLKVILEATLTLVDSFINKIFKKEIKTHLYYSSLIDNIHYILYLRNKRL